MAWVKNLRDSKNIVFIELSDGTCFKPIQIVVDKELENFEEVRKFNLYTGIRVFGKLVETKEQNSQSKFKQKK